MHNALQKRRSIIILRENIYIDEKSAQMSFPLNKIKCPHSNSITNDLHFISQLSASITLNKILT